MHWVLPFRKKELTTEQAWQNYLEKLDVYLQAENLVILSTRKTATAAEVTAAYTSATVLSVRKAIVKCAIVMTDEWVEYSK